MPENSELIDGLKSDDRYPQLKKIQLEIVNRCNYRCPLCRTLQKDWVPRGEIAVVDLAGMVAPVAGQIEGVDLFGTRGEPFIHDRLEDIVAYLKRTTRAKIVISTNGSLATPERAQRLLDAGLDQIVFAVDGITQASYGAYRVGGTLERVVENIRAFCRCKEAGGYPTRVIFQFIPMAGNEDELPDIPGFAYDLGVDLVKAKLSSSVYRSRRFQTASRRYAPDEAAEDIFTCPFGIHKVYVDPNRYVYPCCYAEGVRELRIGNAGEGLLALWHAAAMRPFKMAFIRQAGFHDFCVATCRSVPRKRKILIRRDVPETCDPQKGDRLMPPPGENRTPP